MPKIKRMNPKLENVKFLVVDDNASFINLLTILLEEIGVKHLSRAHSAEEFLQKFYDEEPDICIIDIELSPGKKDGGDVAIKLREENFNVPIIFLTSYFQQDFYDYVKSVKPIGFMNKELSKLKLLQTVELAIDQLQQRSGTPSVAPKKRVRTTTPATTLTKTEGGHIKQIFFKVGDSYKPINVDDIDLFFADNKLTYAHVESRNYPTVVKLKVLTEELEPKFLRCHKKYLVNVDKIDSILLKEGKVKVGEELLPIGYAYRKAFLERINLLK